MDSLLTGLDPQQIVQRFRADITADNERAANARSLAAYRERCVLSRDPEAAEESILRRAVVGMAIQAAIRKRERLLRLRERAHRQTSTAAPSNVVQIGLPANVVQLAGRRHR